MLLSPDAKRSMAAKISFHQCHNTSPSAVIKYGSSIASTSTLSTLDHVIEDVFCRLPFMTVCDT